MRIKWYLFAGIIVFCLLGTMALGYIAYTSAIPSSSSTFIEVTKTVFLCLGGIGVLMPIYLGAMDSIESRKYSKIENTFNLIVKWDDPHLFSARKLTRDIKGKRSSISDDDLVKEINDSDELKQSVILVFNYFEHVRFSILNERIDTEQLKGSLGVVILDIIARFKPFFKTMGEQNIQDLDELEKLLR